MDLGLLVCNPLSSSLNKVNLLTGSRGISQVFTMGREGRSPASLWGVCPQHLPLSVPAPSSSCRQHRARPAVSFPSVVSCSISRLPEPAPPTPPLSNSGVPGQNLTSPGPIGGAQGLVCWDGGRSPFAPRDLGRTRSLWKVHTCISITKSYANSSSMGAQEGVRTL